MLLDASKQFRNSTKMRGKNKKKQAKDNQDDTLVQNEYEELITTLIQSQRIKKKRMMPMTVFTNMKSFLQNHASGSGFIKLSGDSDKSLESNDSDLHSNKTGITLRQLRIIWDFAVNKCDQHHWGYEGNDENNTHATLTLDKITLHHLEEFFILPITQQKQISLSNTISNTALGKPRWYVTTNKNVIFQDLIFCLEEHSKDFSVQNGDQGGLGVSEDTPIWISSFSMNLWQKSQLEEHANVYALEFTRKNNIIVVDREAEIFKSEEFKTIMNMKRKENDKALSIRSTCIYTAHNHLVDLEKHEHRFAVGITPHGAISDKLDIHTFRREDQFPVSLMETFLNMQISDENSIGKELQKTYIKTSAVLQWILSDALKIHARTEFHDYLSKSLTSIQVYDAPFGSNFLITVANLIKKCENLEDIRIQNSITKKNLITDKDVKYLATVLNKKQDAIKKLDLWGTDQSFMQILIEEGGCNVLFDTDTNGCTRIDYLYIETIPDYTEITFLQRAFLDSNRPLSSLTKQNIRYTLNWALLLEKEDLNGYLDSPEGVFLKQILNMRFCRKNILFLTLLNVVIQTVIAFYVSYDIDFTQNFLHISILSSCLAVQSLFEFIQVVNSIEIKEHLASFKNFVDLAQFGLVSWYLLWKSWNLPHQYWDAYLLVGATGIVWVNLLFYASYLLYPLAIFMSALGQVRLSYEFMVEIGL